MNQQIILRADGNVAVVEMELSVFKLVNLFLYRKVQSRLGTNEIVTCRK